MPPTDWEAELREAHRSYMDWCVDELGRDVYSPEALDAFLERVRPLLTEARRAGAEEMRERAADVAYQKSLWVADTIRALPTEEPEGVAQGGE